MTIKKGNQQLTTDEIEDIHTFMDQFKPLLQQLKIKAAHHDNWWAVFSL
ncbi:hypothetical protein [Secundilactobacillus silagei]|uniref:Uncharacterized protein n=1 Tax=Secundilactobacillus silagei JCM 19001 TaxID=1302250 RepID=A0A1Z5IF47_9LACO|nr:hypothetical protein [Secundilactobacillus silagei]TDG71624.1 hypothetical protein C5L25_002281 [Secundilactobacillus silagei JCM 19001]GAX00387.1 hypothetical protein IWT126_00401 [Secundilactobacillus silagei JCM 19001]